MVRFSLLRRERALMPTWQLTRSGRCSWELLFLSLLCVSPRARADGEFLEPVRITSGEGLTAQSDLSVGPRDRYIADVANNGILIHVLSPTDALTIDLAHPDGLAQGDPVIETTALGFSYVAYAQEPPSFQLEGREIHLANNLGGALDRDENVSTHPADDFGPRMVIDGFGTPHLVWTRSEYGSEEVMYFNVELAEPIVIAAGSYPDLTVDSGGNVHCVYSRDRDLHYLNNVGGQFDVAAEIQVVETPDVEEFDASIASDPRGQIYIAYEARGALHVAESLDGLEFDPPVLVVEDGVSRPELRVEHDAQISLVYSRHGDIFFALASSIDALEPVRLTDTPGEIETSPAMGLDSQGSIHLSFCRAGDVYYTNNAPPPVADFSSDSTAGEKPLEVHFEDLSEGQIQVWRWDFGDGTTSSSRNPVHLYQVAGDYAVQLEVIGPGGRDLKTIEGFISVSEPSNVMRAADVTVLPSETEIWCPVLGTFTSDISAFQVAGTFDSSKVELIDITVLNTYTNSLSPEKILLNFSNDPVDPFFAAGVIIDFDEPRDGRLLRAAENRRLLNLVFAPTPSVGALDEVSVELANNVGPTEVKSTYTIDGVTKLPLLRPGTIRFLDPLSFPSLFVRSDVNGDGGIDISDAINALDYIFLGTYVPPCPDAADHDDSGIIDLTDPIGVLDFSFLGGQVPFPPYPGRGADPTPDPLGPCTF